VYTAPSGSAGASATITERLVVSSSGVRFNNAYTFPTSIGSSGQSLKVPSSGTTLEWGSTSGFDATGTNTFSGSGNIVLPTSGTTSNLKVGGLELQSDGPNANWIFGNLYYDGSDYRYRANGYGTLLYQGAGSVYWFTAPEGTAGNVATLSARLGTTSAGVISMGAYGAGTATFDASGNISSSSDIRLKNVQGRYTAGLAAIMKLHPITYKWNEKSHLETKNIYAGFSAQNVKASIPYGTGEAPDGMLSLQDRAIMAALVNAVKELNAKVEKLEAELKKKPGTTYYGHVK
jgi:hypothetical protein